MRWRGGRRSSNIEDRRGQRTSPKLLGGGIGTIAIILLAWYFGIDPTPLLESVQSGSAVIATRHAANRGGSEGRSAGGHGKRCCC